MAELLAALVELFLAMLLLIAGLMGLVIQAILEAFGFGIAQLASDPPKGERRFSFQRVVAAFLPLFLILAFVFGGITWWRWRCAVHQERMIATRRVIDQRLELLVRQVIESDRPTPADNAPASDAWGNPIIANYDESLTSRHVEVRSAGPDGKQNTADDILASRAVARKKGEIAIEVTRRIKNIVLEKESQD